MFSLSPGCAYCGFPRGMHPIMILPNYKEKFTIISNPETHEVFGIRFDGNPEILNCEHFIPFVQLELF